MRASSPCARTRNWRKPGSTRQHPNFGLAESGMEQRRQNPVFVSRAMARAKIVRVVGIDSIRDGIESASAREQFHLIEQLILAVVAAVGIICHILRIFELVRLDELMSEAHRAHECGGLLAIVLRKTCGKRCYRKRALAERRMRRPCQIRRVSSTGKGN